MYQHMQITKFYNTGFRYNGNHLVAEVPFDIANMWKRGELLFNKNYFIIEAAFNWEDLFIDFQSSFAIRSSVESNADFIERKSGVFVANISKDDPWYMKGKKFELVGLESNFFKEPQYSSRKDIWEIESRKSVC